MRLRLTWIRHRRTVLILILLSSFVVAAACGTSRTDTASPVFSPAEPAPSPTRQPDLVIAVKGDWGAGTPEQAAVTRQMCLQRERTPFEDVITTGDNFYRPDGVATQGNYHQPEQCLLDYASHRWRATWGNHDLAGDSTAVVLGATQRYYTWSAGPVQFFMLDSNRPLEAAQKAWLEQELANSAAPIRIPVLHHAPYSASLHGNDEDVIEQWVPVFEDHGIDLVLSGHSHAYEHSRVGGIDYVVTGGGGASLYPCVDDPGWLLTCRTVNHFLLLKVAGTNVVVEVVDAGGHVIDSFTVDSES